MLTSRRPPVMRLVAIVVDGRFKTEFVDENAALTAAAELLAKYPMLKVEIYDASSKLRSVAT
ncbi:hypothetical protein ACVWZK_001476 [Bradyrhizobium sp. GM0.4]